MRLLNLHHFTLRRALRDVAEPLISVDKEDPGLRPEPEADLGNSDSLHTVALFEHVTGAEEFL